MFRGLSPEILEKSFIKSLAGQLQIDLEQIQDSARKMVNVLATLQSAMPKHGVCRLSEIVLNDMEKIAENLAHVRKSCEGTFRVRY